MAITVIPVISLISMKIMLPAILPVILITGDFFVNPAAGYILPTLMIKTDYML